MSATLLRGCRTRRAVDVVVALVTGLLLLPAIVIIAAVVLVGLGRPVLFAQERSGVNGVPFTMLKFRTMRPPRQGDEADAVRTPGLGRLLRASSLDELPQLWNILRGDMSIIGPRPTLPEQVARYGDYERGRLAVRPGVTGWAQVNGRNAISWETRIDLDIWYIENRSAALDLKILSMTALLLVRPRDIVGDGGVNPGFVGRSPAVREIGTPDGPGTPPPSGTVPAQRTNGYRSVRAGASGHSTFSGGDRTSPRTGQS